MAAGEADAAESEIGHMEQMMQAVGINWLFIVVLVLLIIGIVRGFRQGFLRLVFSLVAGILLIVVVAVATPHIGNFIADQTQLDEKLTARFSAQIEAQAEEVIAEGLEGESEGLGALGLVLPVILGDENSGSGEGAVAALMDESGIGEALGNGLAMLVIKGIAFLVVLIIGIIVLSCIGRLLKKVNNIPVLGKINRGLGVAAGLFESLLIVWVFFAVAAFLNAGGLAPGLSEMIENNILLSFLYKNNLVLAILPSLF